MKKATTTTKAKAPAPAKAAPKPAKKSAAPAVKKSAPKAIVTAISAQVDVGFGNSLYVRGEGAGLSWDKGVLMTCVAAEKWAINLTDATRPIICKFLLNDLIWCVGDDFVVTPGTRVSFAPTF